MSEDPANRRTLGGGTNRIVFHLYPMYRPVIVAAYSADFRPISDSNPARAGDWVILRVAGLGPITPGTTPPGAQAFPQDPPAQVNSNVEAFVGGRAGEVGTKIGWPSETNLYRVDVRVPDGAAAGAAALVVSSAWIDSQEFRIPVH